jgi:hypothetical protein
MSKKKSNETIGNRTRDLLARSAVPQRIAPPRAPFKSVSLVIHCSLFYADKLQNMEQQRFKQTLTGM